MSSRDDHFSAIAKEYARGRFGYPEAIFDYLARVVPRREAVWDCATGTGQAVPPLASRFEQVIATDLSGSLLAQAPVLPNVTYRVAPAEVSGLADHSVDLVTVAQAVHWFCGEPFWREVARVCRPGGVFAFWGYLWPEVNDEITPHLMALRTQLAPYWPERTQLLQNGYVDVQPPFPTLEAPQFERVTEWKRSDYVQHVNSWSAVRYLRERTGADVVPSFEAGLARVWPDDAVKQVRWTVVFRAYRM